MAWLSLYGCLIKTFIHQAIPPAPALPPPPPPRLTPGISIFFSLDGKFSGVGTKKEGKYPILRQRCKNFSLIAQSKSAVLSILMCDFLV